jgi:peptide/nickel transport system permease protein
VTRRVGAARWSLLAGTAVFALILLALLVTPWIAPQDPAAQDLSNRLAAPSARHWLGTDQLGRDTLSRLMYGGRFSVSIAAITLLVCAATGTILGVVSARSGGFVDEIIMRVTDVLLSFPEMVVALFLMAIFRPGYATLVVALTAAGWTPFARLARGLTLQINTREYITAAESLGCSRSFIIVRHVLPNAAGPISAHAFLRFGHILITVGALSFLGLGVQPPASDWGAMLSQARPYMGQSSALVLAPGLTIFLTALAVTMIGRGLQARWDRPDRLTAETTLPQPLEGTTP